MRRRAFSNWIVLALVAAFGWPWPPAAAACEAPRVGTHPAVRHARPRQGGVVEGVKHLRGPEIGAAWDQDDEEDPDRERLGLHHHAVPGRDGDAWRPPAGDFAVALRAPSPRALRLDDAVRLRC